MWNLKKEYDVIITGGGLAGCCAAVAAAETGAATLLIEQNPGPGGVAVFAGCPVFIGFGHNGQQCVSGVAERLLRRLDDIHAAAELNSQCRIADSIGAKPLTGVYSTTEPQLILILNRMLRESGAELLYYTTVTDVFRKGGRIEGLKLFFGGRTADVSGRMFIDASGDAIVAAAAGCEVIEGLPDETMTKTILFNVTNVKSFDKVLLRRKFQEASRAGRFPYRNQDLFMGNQLGNSDLVQLNLSLTAGNALNPSELTKMDIELREQVFVILEWLQKEFPEFRDSRLAGVAPKIGVRAGRNIVAREMITCEDLVLNTPVAEPVAVGRCSIGGHGINRFRNPWEKTVPHPRSIPYGALRPADTDNLLACGRCIGVETKAISSVRLMPICMATGHAAGVAAALSAAPGRIAEYAAVREKLLEQHAILAIEQDEPCYVDN